MALCYSYQLIDSTMVSLKKSKLVVRRLVLFPFLPLFYYMLLSSPVPNLEVRIKYSSFICIDFFYSKIQLIKRRIEIWEVNTKKVEGIWLHCCSLVLGSQGEEISP